MKKYLLLCWIALGFHGAFAQTTSLDGGFSALEEHNFMLKVKLIDEFMSRFNYELAPDGKKLKSDSASAKDKARMIASLFDKEYVLRSKLEKKNEILNQFIATVVSQPKTFKFRFQDSTWFALAECDAKYFGAKSNVNITLRTEKYGNENLKWVIASAKSWFLNVQPQVQSPKSLDPVSHETGFSKLCKATEEDRSNISQYAHKGYKSDNLSVFFFLVKNKHLTLNYTTKTTFHCLQVPGYIFKIENFTREGSNSGWLISEVIPADEAAKKQYTQTKLNIQ
jgi:hypothetical protein